MCQTPTAAETTFLAAHEIARIMRRSNPIYVGSLFEGEIKAIFPIAYGSAHSMCTPGFEAMRERVVKGNYHPTLSEWMAMLLGAISLCRRLRRENRHLRGTCAWTLLRGEQMCLEAHLQSVEEQLGVAPRPNVLS